MRVAGWLEEGEGEEVEIDENVLAEEIDLQFEEDEEGNVRSFRMIQGKAVYIEGDEYVTESNPKGDAKVDANGNLLGGESTFQLMMGRSTKYVGREEIQSADVRVAQPASSAQIHARHRCRTYIWLP